MLRRAAAFLAVLVAAPAAAAQADPPQRADNSAAAIAAYWTKERMSAAVPRDVVRGGEPRVAAGKPGGGGGGSSWTSLAVTPVPYEGADLTNGKVFLTLEGVNYVCSGTSVAASAGVNLVWTAGHCLNEGPGDYATNFMFAPGYADGATPWGKWSFTSLQTTSGWRTQGNLDFDVGAARVAPGEGAPPSGTLADIAPPRPMAFNYPVTVNSTKFKSYGYPAAGRFTGQRLWLCDSTVSRRDGSGAGDPMGIGCDMTPGSSGGGWVNASGAVGSVNSYFYKQLKNVMHGPYQGTVAQALYESMD
jgi:hypothetical protein